jgi:hypothetical protein
MRVLEVCNNFLFYLKCVIKILLQYLFSRHKKETNIILLKCLYHCNSASDFRIQDALEKIYQVTSARLKRGEINLNRSSVITVPTSSEKHTLNNNKNTSLVDTISCRVRDLATLRFSGYKEFVRILLLFRTRTSFG